MANRLILRKKTSPFGGQFVDTTLNSVLSHDNLDDNFIYLKGNIIHTGSTSGTILTLNKINGSEIELDLSSLVNAADTYITGATLTGTSTLVLTNNDDSVITADLSPLLDDTNFYTTATTLVNNVAYFNRTDQLSAYTLDLSSFVFSGGSGDCISDLYVTNIHGCSPITVNDEIILTGNNTSATIKAGSGGGQISLRAFDGDNSVLIATDNEDYGEAGIEMYNNYLGLWNAGYDQFIAFNNAASKHIELRNKIVGSGVDISAKPIGGEFTGDISIVDNASNNKVVDNTVKYPVAISTQSGTFNSGATNSVIVGGSSNTINENINGSVVIGGSNITATVSDSIYTPDIYVQTNKRLRTTNGTGTLSLDYNGTSETILLATNNQNGAYLYVDDNHNVLSQVRAEGLKIGVEIIDNSNNTNDYSAGILIKDNVQYCATTMDVTHPAILISSKNSTINSGVTNSVVIGGSNISAIAHQVLEIHLVQKVMWHTMILIFT